MLSMGVEIYAKQSHLNGHNGQERLSSRVHGDLARTTCKARLGGLDAVKSE
jgi:hypothetical protein